MAEEYRRRAIAIVTDAIVADQENRTEDAFQLYLKAFEWFELTLKYEKNPKTIDCIKRRMFEYIERAELLKGKRLVPQKDGGEDENGKMLSGTILIEKPNVTWDMVAGLDEAIFTLKETVIMPIQFPYIFQDGFIKPWNGILLYGPPGTGKSFLAKAIATEAKATFFSVSSADIVSKWVGESEKMVRSLFEMARARKPSIIFIDEIESLCGQRGEDSSTNVSASRLISEILTQLDGVGRDQSSVLLLAATNLPWSLDIAVRRRLQQRIYIPLPNTHARAKLFKNLLGKENISISKLVKRTEGFSGADISVAVNKARMNSIRKIQTATHFKRIAAVSPIDKTTMMDDLLVPCSPGDVNAIEMEFTNIPYGKLLPPSVELNDYLKSIDSTKPTVKPEDLIEYEKWTSEMGMNGE